MKTSNELYEMLGALVSDAKESIRNILSKQPNQRIEVDMCVVANYDAGADREVVTGIQLKDGMIELLLPDGDIVRNKNVLNSEWFYILECIEYELVEKEGRV